MPPRKKRMDPQAQARIVAEAQRHQALRQQGYRDQALALFPHVCARCGREFSGKNLRELTVHHRDHNHLNNPPDGSNWELLCLYCHDYEHQKQQLAGSSGSLTMERHRDADLDFRPFEGLAGLLKPAEPDEPSEE